MWYLYKGKIPFKCFECGKIGHFASKFPYNKIKDNDELKNIIITRKEGRCTKEENTKIRKGSIGKKRVFIIRRITSHHMNMTVTMIQNNHF